MTDQDQPRTRRTRAPGQRSRARVVEHAAKLATIEGLEGLSIGRLAEATGLPKSSVHALFGSKEELQLATVNAARDSFITEVVAPALGSAGPGRERLLALCEGYLSYVERRVFPGGCFFVAASAEVGAQAGRVHDEVARIQQLQQLRGLFLRQHIHRHPEVSLAATNTDLIMRRIHAALVAQVDHAAGQDPITCQWHLVPHQAGAIRGRIPRRSLPDNDRDPHPGEVRRAPGWGRVAA